MFISQRMSSRQTRILGLTTAILVLVAMLALGETASDAAEKPERSPDDSAAKQFTPEQKAFWAFQQVRDYPLPQLKDRAWPTAPIDSFVLARLEQHGLPPSRMADKRTWLRRVALDVTGLPPTPEQIDGFLNDDAPHCHAKIVDRLLASPHYAERWARHWLDVVRYSDTLGQEADWIIRYAWRYRDYVINAFNFDKPYDQFVVEQIAGDLLPHSDDPDQTLEQVVATGFLMLSPKETAEADKEKMILDIVDEQIDATGRTFMALTIACARCHDHKFDPIPTLDYYSIAGIFRSTRTMVDRKSTSMWSEYGLPYVPADQKRHHDTLKKRIASLKQQITNRRDQAVEPQSAWEKELLTSVSNLSELPDKASIREILMTQLEQRTSELQRTLEIAILADPERAVSLPIQIPGLHAWYQADTLEHSDGDEVKLWKDSHSSGLDLGPGPESTTRPTCSSNGFNGRPSVKYSNPTDELRSDVHYGLTGDLSYAVFFAAEFHLPDPPQRKSQIAWLVGTDKGQGTVQFLEFDSNKAKHRLDIGSSYSQDAETKPLAQNVPVIVSVRKKAGAPINTTSIRVNGVDQQVTGSGQGINVLDGPLFVGYGNSGYAPLMDVAEIVVFNQALTDEQENTVGYYLADKYALETAYVKGTSMVQLVAKSPEKRTPAENETLRDYYVKNHDAEYRMLSSHLEEDRKTLDKLSESWERTMVMAPTEEEKPADLHVYRRGDYNNPGERAPRRFLQIVAGQDHAPIETEGSGRLELARWIAHADNPLTARVMVNRIWQGHFGSGLVRTSDNFGVLGDKPSHPELLDWLATRFVESGWSIKNMHRRMVLSSTYRQVSDEKPHVASVDPENRLSWRMPRRRLEVEPIRDAMLLVSGQLDRTLRGEIPDWWKQWSDPVDEKKGLIAFAKLASNIPAYASTRRSIYLPVSRNQLYEMFVLFDYADASSMLTRRGESAVATQALFMMNNKLVRQLAMQFARQLLARDESDEERLREAHVRAFGRPPTRDELSEAVEYLRWDTEAKTQSGVATGEAKLSAWQNYCQLLFCQSEFIFID